MKFLLHLLGDALSIVGLITLLIAAVASLIALWLLMIIPFLCCNLAGVLRDRPDRVVWNFKDWVRFDWRTLV